MEEKTYISNIYFRILFPLLTGLLAYLIILMVFDSLDQLRENFFSQEAFALVLIALCFSEASVLQIRLLDRMFPIGKKYYLRLALQFLSAMVISVLLTTLVLAVYFRTVYGHVRFASEMTVINILFMVTALAYHLYYLSIYQLYRHRSLVFKKEYELKQTLELELESFIDELNPDLLLDCLETLISIVHYDAGEAEDYVQKLAGQYRYMLDRKRRDIVSIGQEMEAAQNLIDLLNQKYGGSISIKVTSSVDHRQDCIIPGTLVHLVESSLDRSIVNHMQPLKLEVHKDGPGELVFSYPVNDVLSDSPPHPGGWHRINKSYLYYSDRSMKEETRGDRRQVRIPLLTIEDQP